MASSNKMRSELVGMLLADRSYALRENNPGAAVTASSRIVDLMIGRLADESANAKPVVTEIRHVVLHAVLCPMCKERQPVSATPPPPPEPELARQRRASAWDDVPSDDAPSAPAPAPALTPEKTMEVPKLRRTDRRRDLLLDRRRLRRLTWS